MPVTKDHDLLPFVLERAERITTKVDRTGNCWLWRGAADTNGYGQITVNGSRSMRAHRAMWMLHHGKTIPEGMTLDHRCRTRRCVNPAHLEPVTIAENQRRGAVAREGGASIRERVTARGVSRFSVLFREEVDGKVRQRTRTFGSREAAEQHRQLILARRFTVEVATYFRVWDELLQEYVTEVTHSCADDETFAQRLADSLETGR